MAKKAKKVAKAKKPAKAAKASKPKKSAARKPPAKAVPSITIRPRSEVTVRATAPSHERPLTDDQISRIRETLAQKRDELFTVVQRKKEQEIQVGEAEIGDEADIATRSVEKEMLFELTDSEKQTLDMIEAALRKIEKGVFGRCESCRSSIPKGRIEVMPWARYCIRCQAELEVPSAGGGANANPLE